MTDIHPQEFYDVFLKINLAPVEESEKTKQLTNLWQYVIDYALKDTDIHFTSFFSKMAFLCEKNQLDLYLTRDLHAVRKKVVSNDKQVSFQEIKYVLAHTIEELFQLPIPSSLQDSIPESTGINHISREKVDYYPQLKFVCTLIDKGKEQLVGFIDEFPDETSIVCYNISDRNDRFTESIEELNRVQLPQIIQLLEVELRSDGLYYPTSFVIEPDFLVDVTSIASSFEYNGTQLLGYHLNKFFPFEFSIPLLVGNVANFILDKVVGQPNIQLDDLLMDIFNLDTLSWAMMSNDDTRKALQKIEQQFRVIKHVVTTTFPKEGIHSANCYLEPSFYSATYGIQGRLDLLQIEDENYTIVELKSGSTFRPNAFQINASHYTQTLLYDLLIRSTFEHARPKNYILYSKYADNPLRIAPRIAAQQKEALKIRNHIMEIEKSYADKVQIPTIFKEILDIEPNDIKGFLSDKLEAFQITFHRLDAIEKMYFMRMVNFIALEHRLAKIGEYGRDVSNGLAGLWLDSVEEKTEQFEMLSFLTIKENQTMAVEPILVLHQSEHSNELSNFRRGDIAVLYRQDDNNGCLKNQVFKCTIVDIQNKEITVRLRSQQKNQTIFTTSKYWALEHDNMDSNFLKMYRELFAWASAPKEFRDLLLTRRPSASIESSLDYQTPRLTLQQNQLINQMISAKEYFLVWGPPGTGKTSRILAEYLKYTIDQTDQNIYLIAYTNRAVDEICESIQTLGEEYVTSYFRIGSRYSTDPQFSDQLLQQKGKSIVKRTALKEMISSHRIVVGTLSSLLGRPMILEMIEPHQVVVDEASQILEPSIIGILSKFKKFILIGDHHQLPAVVVQKEEESKVESEELQQLGLWDCRDSLFERLYRQNQANGWEHSIGILTQQGRMHQQIMGFSSDQFYNNQLLPLEGIDRLHHEQSFLSLFPSRMNFIHTEISDTERFNKTNRNEVKVVTSLVATLLEQGISSKDIGIIAPFRSQTAAIKKDIEKKLTDTPEIYVDTVERFQGSAKDVIIISFCANNIFHLQKISSLSHEGVDRKLNVALTRARELVVLIGNEPILRRNPLYAELLDRCENLNGNEI